jgi:hypothetical protein
MSIQQQMNTKDCMTQEDRISLYHANAGANVRSLVTLRQEGGQAYLDRWRRPGKGYVVRSSTRSTEPVLNLHLPE